MDYFSTLGAPEHRSLAEALGPQPSLAYWVHLLTRGGRYRFPPDPSNRFCPYMGHATLCRGLQVPLHLKASNA